MEHVWKFQEFCNSMTRLETDSYEYAYLKAIVLFSPGGCVCINEAIPVDFFILNHSKLTARMLPVMYSM